MARNQRLKCSASNFLLLFRAALQKTRSYLKDLLQLWSSTRLLATELLAAELLAVELWLQLRRLSMNRNECCTCTWTVLSCNPRGRSCQFTCLIISTGWLTRQLVSRPESCRRLCFGENPLRLGFFDLPSGKCRRTRQRNRSIQQIVLQEPTDREIVGLKLGQSAPKRTNSEELSS